MTVPHFFDRFADAALPLLEEANRETLRAWLEELGLTLAAPATISEHQTHQEGFILACNLAARLYPRLHIQAPSDLAERARSLVQAINPTCDMLLEPREGDVVLSWGEGSPSARTVVVHARSWTAYVDHEPADALMPCEAPAALAAAALGAAHAFRAAFAEQLGNRGRHGSEPGTLNVVTHDASTDDLAMLIEPVDIGTVHLVGCGAIGQACALALSTSPVRGTLWAVDHEEVALSNLQRYVLTRDDDIDTHKPALVARAFEGTEVRVKQLRVRWGAHRSAGPGAETVLTALDTAADRIDVQGSLPRAIYNAYTQPTDLGVSRHEHFGHDACLACLYWPTTTIPGRHEQIASAIGEHPLRVLGYLVFETPVGEPLPPNALQPAAHLALPDDCTIWTERSLLDDLIARRGLDSERSATWKDATAEDFYVGAVCGGDLITDADTGRDVVVPLAHQSVLAGILLAVQLIAARHPELAQRRPNATRGWLDLMRPLPSTMAQVAGRTPGCLCSDADFVAHWTQTWAGHTAEG